MDIYQTVQIMHYLGKGDGGMAGGGGAYGRGDHTAQGIPSLHSGGEVPCNNLNPLLQGIEWCEL